MLRFKVGELAIFMFGISPEARPYAGTTVEILEAERKERATFDFGTDIADYVVARADGSQGMADDLQLRKIDPPAEPASLTRHAEDECTA
jgi:hypothetical protein